MWSIAVVLAAHPGGFRGRPRRSVAALYRGDARLRRGRAGDGLAVRPVRHRRAGGGWRGDAGARLRAGEPGDRYLAVHSGAWPADRRRRLGQFRPDRRRYLALVRAPPRHRRRDLFERQLSRRRDLAAGHPAAGAERRVARRLSRHRRVLRRGDAAAAAGVPAAAADRSRRRGPPRRESAPGSRRRWGRTSFSCC